MFPQLEKGEVRAMFKEQGIFYTTLTLILYWIERDEYREKMKVEGEGVI